MGFLLFCEHASVPSTGTSACLTRSFRVRGHIQSHTGKTKTVNKGPWHHLGRREEHLITQSQYRSEEFGHSLATNELLGAINSYQTGDISVSFHRVPPSWTGSQPLTLLVTFVKPFTLSPDGKGPEHNLKFVPVNTTTPPKQPHSCRYTHIMCRNTSAGTDVS